MCAYYAASPPENTSVRCQDASRLCWAQCKLRNQHLAHVHTHDWETPPPAAANGSWRYSIVSCLLVPCCLVHGVRVWRVSRVWCGVWSAQTGRGVKTGELLGERVSPLLPAHNGIIRKSTRQAPESMLWSPARPQLRGTDR